MGNGHVCNIFYQWESIHSNGLTLDGETGVVVRGLLASYSGLVAVTSLLGVFNDNLFSTTVAGLLSAPGMKKIDRNE